MRESNGKFAGSAGGYFLGVAEMLQNALWGRRLGPLKPEEEACGPTEKHKECVLSPEVDCDHLSWRAKPLSRNHKSNCLSQVAIYVGPVPGGGNDFRRSSLLY
jgi:hypothetical protein